jgi:ABC-2 type transport system permease protein
VVALGAIVLAVPVRGSIALLFAVSALFLTGMVGQGLLVSIVTRNQLVATQAGIVSSLLPTILLSGFLSPIENMPLPLQALSTVIPSRYFIQVLRRLMLDGAGIRVLWPSIAPLVAYATVMLAAAILAFRRRLD